MKWANEETAVFKKLINLTFLEPNLLTKVQILHSLNLICKGREDLELLSLF